VLRFEAVGKRGGGGGRQSYSLLPLNRVVDESYAVYFNLTGGC
jgi:hypothetical protein